MVTIDASLDELTGVTIIITTIINTTDRTRERDSASLVNLKMLGLDRGS